MPEDGSNRYLCIHGHFYQPPRENPWLESVERQDSASPYHDWNERVGAECYGPNAAARILDAEGWLAGLRNNYENISFNFGPTLLSWMKTEMPGTYSAVLEADKRSRERHNGHGAAIAQAYNHMILPLASPRDVTTQIAWGIADFEHRFGRKPEGLWLPETAANTPVLEAAAAAGIAFTILSPHQARRVRRLRGRTWKDVSGGQVDPSRAYQAALPSKRRLALFFYDGPISQGVAFEGLLNDGMTFAKRLREGFSEGRTWPQLMHIATDGESYGHHHRHGEMALAWTLDHVAQEGWAKLVPYGEYLAAHPPTHEAEIWENSSWSCSHGVERWKSNCGCRTGSAAGWNQNWRAPLRAALDWLRDRSAELYERGAAEVLRDPWGAREAYIQVVLNRSAESRAAFFKAQAARELQPAEASRALQWLEMERHAMLMYTSCGWFFDELSGLETVQVLRYAGRVVELGQRLGGEGLEDEFLKRLAEAHSNLPEMGNGAEVYRRFVHPVSLEHAGGHYGLSSLFEERGEVPAGTTSIYDFEVTEHRTSGLQEGRWRLRVGHITLCSRITQEERELVYAALHLGDHNLRGGIAAYDGDEKFAALLRELETPFRRADLPETLLRLEQHFAGQLFSLQQLFRDEQWRILDRILADASAEVEGGVRALYDGHAALLRFLREQRLPAPPFLQQLADTTLRLRLHSALRAEPLDLGALEALSVEAEGVAVNLATAEDLHWALRLGLRRMAEAVRARPQDAERLERLAAAVELARRLPLGGWREEVQEVYWGLIPHVLGGGSSPATQERFLRLGEELRVRTPQTEADAAA